MSSLELMYDEFKSSVMGQLFFFGIMCGISY